MSDMNDQEMERAEKQRAYLERIDTGGGDLVPTRYEPRDLPSLMDFSNMVARSGLCPHALQGKPQDVALVLMSGAERGFTAMQALQNMHVVKGRVAMSADIIRAQCQRHPSCEGFELLGVTEEKAEIQVKKKGWKDSVVVEFTMEDARRAGLMRDGSAWKTFPKAMLVARATTQAARWYFPDVMAGIMEETEAKELEPEQQLASQPSAKAKKAAEALHAAAQPAPEPPKATDEDDVVDGEVVDEEPPRPEPGVKERLAEAAVADAVSGLEEDLAEKIKDHARRIRAEEAEVGEVSADEAANARFAAEVVETPTIGAKTAAALVAAGFTTWAAIAEAPDAKLLAVDGIGKLGMRNLQKEAAKRVGTTETATEPQQPPSGSPAAEGAVEPAPAEPWTPQPTAEPLAHRPIYRGEAYMKGLRDTCGEHGVTWSQVLAQAKSLSGGYDPARLNDQEWKTLFEWIKSAKQEGLFEATRDGDEPPRYELVKEHPKYKGEPIEEEIVASLLRYAERTEGMDEAKLRARMRDDWGFELEALPMSLYVLALECATAGDYDEAVEGMVEREQAKELS